MNSKNLEIAQELGTRLAEFFTTEHIDGIAKSTSFIMRESSRLRGLMFLQLNMFSLLSQEEKSLTDQCDYLEDTFGLSISKQSLDERYNTYAVAFMKASYEAMLKEVLQPYITPLEQKANEKELPFKGIELADSTVFDIGAQLQVFYKGGGQSTSAIKIQQRYDLLRGETLGFKITSGNESDVNYTQDLNKSLIADWLYIKDLGYYKASHFVEISKSGAYFLSRYKGGTNLYIKDENNQYKKVHMIDLVPKYGEKKEIPVIYVGQNKLKVRMIIDSVPEEYIEQRKAKVIKKNKNNYRIKLHPDALLLCSFNVFITNAGESILPFDKIRLLYALRWQIELIFKIWKSIFSIDKDVKKMNIFRFECYLYGRLMAILLSEKIQNLYRDYLWEEEQLEISEYKCAKIIKKNLMCLEEPLGKV